MKNELESPRTTLLNSLHFGWHALAVVLLIGPASFASEPKENANPSATKTTTRLCVGDHHVRCFELVESRGPAKGASAYESIQTLNGVVATKRALSATEFKKANLALADYESWAKGNSAPPKKLKLPCANRVQLERDADSAATSSISSSKKAELCRDWLPKKADHGRIRALIAALEGSVPAATVPSKKK